MFGMRHRNLPAVIMHCGKTAYHNVDNPIPCFYVIVPDGVGDIDCHGGVTYGASWDDDYSTHVPGHDHIEVPEGYHVLGWDYTHYDDDDLTDEEVITDVKETLENIRCKTI